MDHNRELREGWRPRSPSSNAGLGSWRIVRAPNKRYEVPGLLNVKTYDCFSVPQPLRIPPLA